MNIVLIGYRGSGKTSIGRKLADNLAMQFADVDHLTCQRFGNDSIAEIWREHGEPAWRQAEIAVTRELCRGDNRVIALGGGTLMQPQARQAVEQAADTRRIYLKCTPEELHRRIVADDASTATRPALTDKGGGIEEIEHMLAEREPVYEQVADVVFDVTHTSIDQAVQDLIKQHL